MKGKKGNRGRRRRRLAARRRWNQFLVAFGLRPEWYEPTLLFGWQL